MDRVTHSRFRTHCTVAAQQFLGEAYAEGEVRLHGRPQEFALRQERLDAGDFWLDDVRSRTGVEYAVGPLDHLVVCRLLSGRLSRRCAESQDSFGPGDIFLAADPALPHTTRADDVHVQMIGVRVQAIDRVLGPEADHPTRWAALQPASPRAEKVWAATFEHVADVLEEASAERLALANATRLVAATVLATFPQPDRADPASVARDRRDATPESLRRAMAFAETYADGDIGLAEMALAARVTPRALQYAFRHHLDTTPGGYLRAVRLERARQDLMAADQSRGDTVGAIAARWGFFHQGRFAAAYRTAYGTSPNQALHADLTGHP